MTSDEKEFDRSRGQARRRKGKNSGRVREDSGERGKGRTLAAWGRSYCAVSRLAAVLNSTSGINFRDRVIAWKIREE